MTPYLRPRVDEYQQLRTEIEELQTRAAEAGRDLAEDELTTIRGKAARAKVVYEQIQPLLEDETRNAKIGELAARIADATAPGAAEAAADGVPRLMPSREQLRAMVAACSADHPTPMRFTTADPEPGFTRAVVTLSGDAGIPAETMSPPELPEPTRIATAAGLSVERVAGASGVVFPVFLAGAAGVTAENVAKTEYSAIDPGSAAPQMVNAFTDYTRQLALSHGAFETRLRAKLAALVAAREDILLQDKVMATVGIQTQAFVAGSQANQVLIGAAKVQAAVSQFPDVALCNPADIGLLFGAGLANTPPEQLAQLDLRLFGMKVYPTNAQEAGFVLAGAWRASSRLVVGLPPTYLVDPFSGLKNNRITTLLEEAVDLAVEEPAGFISIDIITP